MNTLSAADIKSLQFYARRYADGRATYAVTEVNDITARMIEAGIQPTPDNCGNVFAEDRHFKHVKTDYIIKHGKDGMLKKP